MSTSVTINDHTFDAPPGATLLDCAGQIGVRVPTSCWGNGSCRECLVEVAEGRQFLTPPSVAEEHLDGRFRLACQARVIGDSGAVTCHTLRRGALSILEDATAIDGLISETPLDPAVTRHGRQILLDGHPIARSTGPIFGVAIDIGTTTVVLRLVDLETGRICQSQSFENPQRFGGSDVMARINYDTRHGQRILQQAIVGYVSRALRSFDCDPVSIYELVIVGNSTMRDLFFGLSVHSIGQRPYWSVTQHEVEQGKRESTSLATTAERFSFPICPKARVCGIPIIHGHVGADAAACLLAVDSLSPERIGDSQVIALMDIGTNTELIIRNGGHVWAASCPAGPAFEGGAVTCGMPALPGAIEAVRIASDGLVDIEVVGNCPAVGICGSGLVDLLGELVRTGRVNAMGRLTDESDRFVIDTERNIFLSESDIAELVQAKAANSAGLRIVLGRAGLKPGDIDRFYLAGAFAHHLDIDAARQIGLVPDLPDERILQVGNTAIAGATQALVSSSRRRALEAFVQQIEHVELETDPEFFDRFVEGCMLTRMGTGGE